MCLLIIWTRGEERGNLWLRERERERGRNVESNSKHYQIKTKTMCEALNEAKPKSDFPWRMPEEFRVTD